MTETCIGQLGADVEGSRSVIFFGDLNTHTDRRGYDLMMSTGWRDSYEAAGGRAGPDEIPTFIDDGRRWPSRRIDHVLYRSSRLRAIDWYTVELTEGPSRLSDHFPVIARFVSDQQAR